MDSNNLININSGRTDAPQLNEKNKWAELSEDQRSGLIEGIKMLLQWRNEAATQKESNQQLSNQENA